MPSGTRRAGWFLTRRRRPVYRPVWTETDRASGRHWDVTVSLVGRIRRRYVVAAARGQSYYRDVIALSTTGSSGDGPNFDRQLGQSYTSIAHILLKLFQLHY